MNIQSPASRRSFWASATVAVLALSLLPAIAAAQSGGGSHGAHRGGGHRGSGGHGGWGHGGGHYGGRHGGHYGGYYGGHRGWGHGYRYPYRGYYSYYSPYSYGLYGYWPYGRYWGAYSPYGDYPSGYGAYAGSAFGAIDIDLAPESVGVFEDGRLLGTADDFDGFPSYLWLEAGTHELTFYLDGYRSLVREVVVTPARVVSVDGRLEPGESSPPQPAAEASVDGGVGIEAEGPAAAPRERRVPTDLRRTPARLLLSVEPGDASVYLDGRFIGTGKEVSAGVILDPGTHVLEVVRPERQGSVWSFDIEAGSEIEHRIELAPR